MTTQLGDLLDEARRRTFVGRRRELASFDDALEGRSSRRVLLVHGPGGIGKTTLLLELRTRGRDAGRALVLLDAREIDPSPEGFEHAVLAALGEPPGGPVAGRLAGAVLLVDGYEQLGPIDGWLRQAFLPALPADALVVLAGRDAPAPPWRTDPGWRSLVAVHRLDHFDEVESDELLALAGVGKALLAAGLVDHDACRAYQSLASFLATPDELFAQPGLLDRVLTLGAGAPQYPLPGPARQELLTAIAD